MFQCDGFTIYSMFINKTFGKDYLVLGQFFSSVFFILNKSYQNMSDDSAILYGKHIYGYNYCIRNWLYTIQVFSVIAEINVNLTLII